MRIITQLSLFDDTQNENLGDLERLQNVFENIPDENLIRKLKEIRGKGRNEWPVEAMWNSFIASFIFDHDSVASLLRELNRNSQLRILCGFQPHMYSVLTKEKDEYGRRIRESRYKLAPTASAYTNFLNNLKECQKELREMFDIRNSKKWKRLYKKRTSIERVNGRIDRDFKFEKHTIRGLEKMKMFLTVTFIIQLASAKAKIESGTKSGLAKHCA